MKRRNRVVAFVLAVMLFTVTAYAEKFTPSVQQKGAPEIVMVNDQNGNEVVAIIKDASGKEVAGVSAANLQITPVSDAAKASAEIREMLENAYKQITDSDSLKALIPNLPDVLKEMKWDIPAEALVVRDLFDVSLVGESKDLLAQEGNTITVRFKLGLTSEEQMLTLHNFESDKWEAIYGAKVERHDNGDVSVTFDSLSPVAFAVKNDSYVAPAESGSNGMMIGAIVVVAVVAGIVVVLLVKNNKNKKKQNAKKQEQKVH